MAVACRQVEGEVRDAGVAAVDIDGASRPVAHVRLRQLAGGVEPVEGSQHAGALELRNLLEHVITIAVDRHVGRGARGIAALRHLKAHRESFYFASP